MWKYIYEMGVLAQQEVVSCVGFLGKYVINFAGLHSDWLGYGQMIYVCRFVHQEVFKHELGWVVRKSVN